MKGESTMQKIGFLSAKGKPDMTIYYDQKAKVNPYRVFLEWYELGELGCRKRKKQIDRYADLNSCGLMLAKYASNFNEEGR